VVDGANVTDSVNATLAQMRSFTERVRSGEWKGYPLSLLLRWHRCNANRSCCAHTFLYQISFFVNTTHKCAHKFSILKCYAHDFFSLLCERCANLNPLSHCLLSHLSPSLPISSHLFPSLPIFPFLCDFSSKYRNFLLPEKIHRKTDN
jgi:hypothetical protein